MGIILGIIIVLVVVLVGWSACVAASDADDYMGYM